MYYNFHGKKIIILILYAEKNILLKFDGDLKNGTVLTKYYITNYISPHLKPEVYYPYKWFFYSDTIEINTTYLLYESIRLQNTYHPLHEFRIHH